MEDTAKNFCSILFDVLENQGVRHVVCSPGSRNVPLLIAASSRASMRKHFAVDERSGAFFGLGLSLVKKEPVALICTSGTALLNYAPAVAEAYYQGVPLIVVSADRPIQWIDQDDSQTLRQDGALENYVKKSFSIPAYGDEDEEMQWFVSRIANEAMMEALDGKPGPVHINVHLGEPLGIKVERMEKRPSGIKLVKGNALANKELVRELANEIGISRVMIVAGFGFPDSRLQKAMTEFSRYSNIVVMAETISNLHLKETDYCIDTVLTAYEDDILDKMAPDIVISLGGALVSRKLKEYLRRNKNTQHWAIGYSNFLSDPFMNLSLRIEADPERLLRNLNTALRKVVISGDVNDYQREWQLMRTNASMLKDEFIHSCAWSEIFAFDHILNNLPGGTNLFLSNGTPIRYAQILNYSLPHASYCNRGVSGIDGSVSTAVGGAVAYKGPTILVTGDLSMAYDIGALALPNIPERFKIIVIDNQGGGIFRFIPSTRDLEEREEYLCQNPMLPIKELASGYGWSYFECNEESSFKTQFDNFISESKRSILKVSCNGEESAKILQEYMNLMVASND